MQTRKLFSLPMVLVVVLALALGSFGTAEASGLTKGAVKKIAAKVVAKKAPSLSVAHAGTADTATTAANSASLNGSPASTYLDRVAFGATTGFAVTMAGSAVQLIPTATSITVPAGINFLHITGSVTGGSGGADFIVWAQVDGVCALSGPDYNIRQYGNAINQMSITVNFVAPVTAGTHTVRLCGYAGTSTNAYDPTLTVETVAGGNSGTSVLAVPHQGAAPRTSSPASTR